MTVRANGEAMRERILDAIAALTLELGIPPSLEELKDRLGLTSVGHLEYHLRILRVEGRLAPSGRFARRALRLAGPLPQDPLALARENERLRREITELRDCLDNIRQAQMGYTRTT